MECLDLDVSEDPDLSEDPEASETFVVASTANKNRTSHGMHVHHL